MDVDRTMRTKDTLDFSCKLFRLFAEGDKYSIQKGFNSVATRFRSAINDNEDRGLKKGIWRICTLQHHVEIKRF